MATALSNLHAIGFVDDVGGITEKGSTASTLPVGSKLAAALLAAPLYRVTREVITIAAVLEAPPLFRMGARGPDAEEAFRRFVHTESDHLTLLTAMHAAAQVQATGGRLDAWAVAHHANRRSLRNALLIRKQLSQSMEKQGFYDEIVGSKDEALSQERFNGVRKALLWGFFTQVAHLGPDGKYRTCVGDHVAQIDKASAVTHRPEWIIYQDLSTGGFRNFLKTVTQVRAEWLTEIAPRFYDPDVMQNAELAAHIALVLGPSHGRPRPEQRNPADTDTPKSRPTAVGAEAAVDPEGDEGGREGLASEASSRARPPRSSSRNSSSTSRDRHGPGSSTSTSTPLQS